MMDPSPPSRARAYPTRERAVAVVERVERRRSGSWRRPTPRAELAISGGAIVGVLSRYGVGNLTHVFVAPTFPFSTLLINVAGCVLIGLMQTLFLELLTVRREIQLFVAVGLLGGFTTFSTFSVETIQLVQDGRIAAAVTYQALMLTCGVLAVLIGRGLAFLTHRRLRRFGRRAR